MAHLEAAWRAWRAGRIAAGCFRVWLADLEVRARRSASKREVPEAYPYVEAGLLAGVSVRLARRAIRDLGGLGLAGPPADPQSSWVDTIGGGRGWLAIPRRLLRFLAAARPAIQAVALGTLLRSASRRRDGWAARGRVKASWVAEAFGLSVRQVRSARAELVAAGWMEPEGSGQVAMNRWGRPYRVDLGWSPHPPLPRPGRGTSPPPVDQEPLRGQRDQEPAAGRPDGVRARGWGKPLATPPPPRPGLGDPDLRNIRPEDLRDRARCLRLYALATAAGLATASESGLVEFLALARHALAIGKVPGALFASLMRRGLWRYATARDEEAGVGVSPGVARPGASPGVSGPVALAEILARLPIRGLMPRPGPPPGAAPPCEPGRPSGPPSGPARPSSRWRPASLP